MKRLRKPVIVMLILLLILSAVACTSNTDNAEDDSSGDTSTVTYPLTITDDLGNEITFESAPEKIVSVSPGHTEILFALELGDKIVGRSEYCNYPAETEDILQVGSYTAPNTEAIIDVAPDVVFSYSAVPDDSRQLLEGAGIKVVIFYPSDVDGVMSNIETVGKIFNVQEKASEVVDSMQTKREEIVNNISGLDSKRVFIDISPGFWSVGSNTFMGSIVEELGGINIAADAETEFPQLSLEKVIEANPEVYISTGTTLEDLQAAEGLDTIDAFKNDMVTIIPWGTTENDIVQRPGPRIIEGLEIYAKAIYPEAF